MGLATPILEDYRMDFSLTLGGPIIQDKVWFFLNPQTSRFERGTPYIPWTDPFGDTHPEYPLKNKEYAGLAKVTTQLSSKMKLVALYQGTYTDEDPCPIWLGWNMPYESQKNWIDYAHTGSGVLTYVANQDTFFDLRVGYVYRRMDIWLNTENKTGTFEPAYIERGSNQR